MVRRNKWFNPVLMLPVLLMLLKDINQIFCSIVYSFLLLFAPFLPLLLKQLIIAENKISLNFVKGFLLWPEAILSLGRGSSRKDLVPRGDLKY